MEQVERLVVGSEKLIAVFGKWPSFHDAEVHELFLSRHDAEPGKERTPTCLIAKIHLWEMTSEVDSKGYYVLQNHTLASLCFWGIEELELQGFNHQNVLSDLTIKLAENPRGSVQIFKVEFGASFGLSAKFECERVEVLEVVACTSAGASLS